MTSIKRIGVFTSGGDAPGMNAAIRAVVRTAAYHDINVHGIYRGYEGMIDGDIIDMNTRSVNRIIDKGGTVLKTARSKEFRTYEGRKKAFENIKAKNIDALVAIGGDGSFTGAKIFQEEFGIPIIGLPGTIDNDLYGTDYTIGYDSATNVVIQCVDKIRDTAQSHNRLFFVEVMGRDSGFIALRTGLATGAIAIMLPEKEQSIEELVKALEEGHKNKKTSSIVIVAEGDENGGAFEIAKKVQERYQQYETKVTILGHLQRGGSPSCFDRVLASYLGYYAIQGLLEGKSMVMAGLVDDKIKYTSFDDAINKHQDLNLDLLKISNILSK